MSPTSWWDRNLHDLRSEVCVRHDYDPITKEWVRRQLYGLRIQRLPSIVGLTHVNFGCEV